MIDLSENYHVIYCTEKVKNAEGDPLGNWPFFDISPFLLNVSLLMVLRWLCI